MIDIINKYEAGVKNREMFELFLKEFEAKQIGILNSEELSDPLATPKFGEAKDGQFLAIEKDGKIFIFPNPAVKVDRVTVAEQETIFFVDVREIRHGQSFHVVKPGILKRVDGSFERTERGRLCVY
jgi:hypothetical protein